MGTGAEMALGVLDADYKEGMTEDEAKNLAIKAIKSSIQRDSASGDGIDLLLISNNGILQNTLAAS